MGADEALDTLRAAAFMAFVDSYGCGTADAARAALALHPLDNRPVPGRQFEKQARKIARIFARQVKGTSAIAISELAKATLMQYKSLALKYGETYYITRYDHQMDWEEKTEDIEQLAAEAVVDPVPSTEAKSTTPKTADEIQENINNAVARANEEFAETGDVEAWIGSFSRAVDDVVDEDDEDLHDEFVYTKALDALAAIGVIRWANLMVSFRGRDTEESERDLATMEEEIVERIKNLGYGDAVVPDPIYVPDNDDLREAGRALLAYHRAIGLDV